MPRDPSPIFVADRFTFASIVDRAVHGEFREAGVAEALVWANARIEALEREEAELRRHLSYFSTAAGRVLATR